jgi:hypothetical protein
MKEIVNKIHYFPRAPMVSSTPIFSVRKAWQKDEKPRERKKKIGQ